MDAPRFTVVRSTRTSRISALVALALVAALAAAPWWAGRANLRLLGEVYSFVALASLWNLLAGYAGLVSVGQHAFVGLGGYMLFALAMFAGVPPLAAIPLAGLVGAVLALPLGPLLFRLQGAYFAIGTWVAAEVFRLGFAQVSALGGGYGISLPAGIVATISPDRALREASTYWVALALAVGTIVVVVALLRSKFGLALTAIRDSEVASESLGVGIARTKLVVYVAVAGLTSMVGAFIFLQKLRLSPDAGFSLNDWTAYVIFIAVIGGLGTIEGPIIGTVVFFLLRETLSELGTVYLMILGAVAIVMILKAPKGLWGTFSDRTGIVLIPVRRRVLLSDHTETRK